METDFPRTWHIRDRPGAPAPRFVLGGPEKLRSKRGRLGAKAGKRREDKTVGISLTAPEGLDSPPA